MPAEGKVIQIIGPVVDVEFPPEQLPALYNAVYVEGGSDGERLVMEVAQHLGDNVVRCVAMAPTEGLMRGQRAVDAGDPIMVPGGDGTLGRLMNVVGEAIDELGPVEGDEALPIHRPAPSLEEQSVETELLETRVKVIDFLTP
ncbi:MAG: F0F1 ATP synthase subunit beta, partial [Planctomycetota bacterium]